MVEDDTIVYMLIFISSTFLAFHFYVQESNHFHRCFSQSFKKLWEENEKEINNRLFYIQNYVRKFFFFLISKVIFHSHFKRLYIYKAKGKIFLISLRLN